MMFASRVSDSAVAAVLASVLNDLFSGNVDKACSCASVMDENCELDSASNCGLDKFCN